MPNVMRLSVKINIFIYVFPKKSVILDPIEFSLSQNNEPYPHLSQY